MELDAQDKKTTCNQFMKNEDDPLTEKILRIEHRMKTPWLIITMQEVRQILCMVL